MNNTNEKKTPEVMGVVKLGKDEYYDLTTFKKIEKFYKRAEWIYKELPNKVKEIAKQNKEGERAMKLALKEFQKNKKSEKREFSFDFADIDLYETETYDLTKFDYYEFKTAQDAKGDYQLDLGNQCSGYDFAYEGYEFGSVESLYLCAQFSEDTEECRALQRRLINEKNGFLAKKLKHLNEHLIRKDWDSRFKSQWMLYCIWQKCQHSSFAAKLLSFPEHAYFIEDSTTIHESTNIEWGSFNKELLEAKQTVREYAELYGLDPDEEANKIHYIGKFEGGMNFTGKVIKLCQIALLKGCEPPIDYDFLRSKNIYLCGKKLSL